MSEIKVMNDDEIRDFCIKKDLKIFELEQQLQQKENKEKEIREKIEGVRIYGLRSGKALIATLLNDILEILDKGSDK